MQQHTAAATLFYQNLLCWDAAAKNKLLFSRTTSEEGVLATMRPFYKMILVIGNIPWLSNACWPAFHCVQVQSVFYSEKVLQKIKMMGRQHPNTHRLLLVGASKQHNTNLFCAVLQKIGYIPVSQLQLQWPSPGIEALLLAGQRQEAQICLFKNNNVDFWIFLKTLHCLFRAPVRPGKLIMRKIGVCGYSWACQLG